MKSFMFYNLGRFFSRLGDEIKKIFTKWSV